MKKYDSPEDVVIKLKKLIKKIEQFYSRIDTSEVTRSQMRVIFPIIKDSRGYSMQELSELVGVNKALVSRTVAALESKSIIERAKDSNSNERNYKIILTSKGKEFFTKQKKEVDKLSNELFNGVSKEDVFLFIDILNKFIEK